MAAGMFLGDPLSFKGMNHRCSDDMTAVRSPQFKTNWTQLSELYNIVVKDNDRAQHILDNCGFSAMFHVKLLNADNQTSEAIMERWFKKTKTFHFPEFEIGLTPLDFVRITGIPIGGGRLKPECNTVSKADRVLYDEEWFSGARAWRNELDQRRTAALQANPDLVIKPVPSWGTEKPDVISGHIVRYIEGRKGMDNNPIADELTRMFLFWCIGRWLVGDTTTRLKKGWLRCLVDLDNVGNYDWGWAALGNLYEQLDKWSSRVSNDMGGMWMILEYWYYFYFRNCQPLPKRSANLAPELARRAPLPALALFDKTNIDPTEQVALDRHSLYITRQNIDSRTASTVEWQPWIMDAHCGDPMVVEARRVSGLRIQFQNSHYLPERCWRQLTGDIVIPTDLPNEDSPIQDGEELIALSHYLPVPPDHYLKWWTSKSVGKYLPLVQHARNKDEFGVANRGRAGMPYGTQPDLYSRSSQYTPQHEVYRDLPEIFDTFHVYRNGRDITIPLGCIEPIPYDPTEINRSPDELLSHIFKQQAYINSMRATMYDVTKGWEQGSSSSNYDFERSNPDTSPNIQTQPSQVPNTGNLFGLSLGMDTGAWPHTTYGGGASSSSQGAYANSNMDVDLNQSSLPMEQQFDHGLEDMDTTVQDTQSFLPRSWRS